MTVLEPVIGFICTLKVNRKITLSQVMEGSDCPRKPVLRVLDRLVKEGSLIEIEDKKVKKVYGAYGRALRNPVWQILSLPIYTNPKSPKRRTKRDIIWKAMRDRRRFTRSDLERLSGCTLGTISHYTKLLEHHNKIKCIGKDGRQKVYMIAMAVPPVQRPILEENINVK